MNTFQVIFAFLKICSKIPVCLSKTKASDWLFDVQDFLLSESNELDIPEIWSWAGVPSGVSLYVGRTHGL